MNAGSENTSLGAARRRAEQVLAGGVSRGFNFLPELGPIYFKEADGARITDLEGARYLDYVMGWGSLFLGHDPPAMRQAILEQMTGGFVHQYETTQHIELAEALCECVPGAQTVRFASSGLEATSYAIRLARAVTRRNKIIKMEGHFHGLHDQVLFGTAASPLGRVLGGGAIEAIPASAGIPPEVSDLTLVLSFNDIAGLEEAVFRHRDQIAGIILEPIALNMGCVRPDPGYLQAVSEISRKHDIVLIFDEVLTGFRVALGGAQDLYGVTPDLSCFSKAFGCGMPIAALSGRRDLMSHLGPPGDVPMSGTHSARMLSVAGTLAAVKELRKPGFYEHITRLNDALVEGLRSVAAEFGVPAFVDGLGGRVALYFGLTERPRNMRDIVREWNRRYHVEVYRRLVLEEKVYGLAPLPWTPDPLNISAAHSLQDIAETVDRFRRVLKRLPYEDSTRVAG